MTLPGRPISRREALRIAMETLERAERARLGTPELAAFEWRVLWALAEPPGHASGLGAIAEEVLELWNPNGVFVSFYATEFEERFGGSLPPGGNPVPVRLVLPGLSRGAFADGVLGGKKGD